MNRASRAVAAALVLLAAAPAFAGGGRLEVFFLDVGQGDAVFVSTPSGRTALVDAGPPESAARLVRFLRSRLSGPIDAVVLTHPHADHVGGMIPALRVSGARHLYDPVLDHPSPIATALHRFAEVLGRLERAHARVVRTDRVGTVAVRTDGTSLELEALGPLP